MSDGASDFVLPKRLKEEIDEEKYIQEEKVSKIMKEDKKKRLQIRNTQPIFPGKWRQKPYGTRTYERLTEYHITNNIPDEEVAEMRQLLKTPLDGFVGQSYSYDDHKITEDWMYAFVDSSGGSGTKGGKAVKSATQDNIIRTQIEGLMDIMVAQVQDRVCTEQGVLRAAPLGLGPDLKEVPVWGIDSYTRRMVEIAIEDHVSLEKRAPEVVKEYIERRLLPAINAQPPDMAHNMIHSVNAIWGNPSSSAIEREFSTAIYDAIGEYGLDSFKIHPKGTGVVCVNPNGIPPHVFITEYLGELYPSYRWCERLDVVEQAQVAFELKPTLPDFYNILLERPRHDPAGYGLMYVDASQRANMGSSCSHSCESNCSSAVVARNGKLVIALTTNRPVYFGEELTMDYYSITFSDVEWRAAICLCGKSSCRGSFLHYATQDDLQQVLNLNCGPLYRYALLLKSCVSTPLSSDDEEVLARHGMHNAALGSNPPLWMRKYAVDNLKFVEYERKGLPCALMRPKDNSPSLYSFSEADMDARTVMEQRIQSLVCCFGMVHQVLARNKDSGRSEYPLIVCKAVEAVERVWSRLKVIPSLMEEYLLVRPPTESSAPSSGGAGAKKKGGKKGVAGGETATKTPTKPAVKLTPETTAQIVTAITTVRGILSGGLPSGLMAVSAACTSIRAVLLSLEGLDNAHARLGQLADVLVFWANTSNFSYAQEYAAVESGPVEVYARELGNNIPRSKVDQSGGKTASSSRSRGGKQALKHAVPASVSNTSNETNDVTMKTDVPETASCSDSLTTSESTASLAVDATPVTTSITTDDSPVPAATTSATTSSSSAASIKEEMFYYSPNETIFTGSMKYPPLFTFWQLMGWFNAGTDEKCTAPDLFGCVQLPEPQCCFGPAELPYGPKQREQLISRLADDKIQMMPWPAELKKCFSAPDRHSAALYGSPMLDGALGRVSSSTKVLSTLTNGESLKKMRDLSTVKGKALHLALEEAALKQYQPDNIIPPESNTNWVQCEACKKWRRVAWNIDAEALPEGWVCSMNDWDADRASCALPQDAYDADRENTVSFQVKDKNLPVDYVIGSWRDVFCTKNRIFYEAQIVKKKEGNPKKPEDVMKLQFHFKGWSHSFDEWIPCNSERIEVHNLHTNPSASNAREQELWQGVTGIKAVVRTAFIQTNAEGRKRKSLPVSATSSVVVEGKVVEGVMEGSDAVTKKGTKRMKSIG